MEDVIEKREFARLPFPFSIKIQPNYIGKIINICEKGMAFFSNEAISCLINQAIIYISEKEIIEIKFQVIWSKYLPEDNVYNYGVSFLNLSNTLKERIVNLKTNNNFSENVIEYKIPKFGFNDYTQEAVIQRREWLEHITKINLEHTKNYSLEPIEIKANIENFIGISQVPVGITGPIKVNGQEAKGVFYVPMATTEGTLVATYQRGMLALTKAGGVKVVVVKDKLDITPIFECQDVYEAKWFSDWIDNHFEEIKKFAEDTTKHGILKKIAIYHLGKNVLLNFQYYTKDAMGLNMVNVATHNACLYIKDQVKNIKFYLRCNLSSDKKVSFFNFINSYGKEVLAEAIIPQKIVRRYFSVTSEEIYKFHQLVVLGGLQSGMIGNNCHFSNGLAAIFIACGQDVAQIVNASIGITILNLTPQGDLYITLKLPNLIIGTIGGGTRLKTQREALEIMQCYGENKAIKFAEIIAATLLGGEISILAALTTDSFVKAHINKRKDVIN